MTEELIFYDDISDINSLESIPKSNNNHKKIAFNFGSHKALNEKNLSHEIIENYIPNIEQKKIDELSVFFTTTWYKQNSFKNFIENNPVNVGFLLEFELLAYFFKITKKIFSILNIIQRENPKKITCSSLSNLVEGLIDKDIQLVKIPYENSEKLFYDSIEFSIPVLNKFGKTKISRKNYLQIKSLIESTTSFLFNTKPNFKNNTQQKNILLLDFNPEKYKFFLFALSKLNCNIILLNQRRPAIWNRDSLKIIQETKCSVLNLSDFIPKSQIEINESINEENKKLIQKIQVAKTDDLIEFFTIKNKSFWNIIQKNFLNLLESRSKEILLKSSQIDSLFNNTKLDLIVEWAHVPYEEKLMLEKSSKNGIPSIFLQHGLYAINNIFSKYKTLQPYVPSLNSKMIVWGNSTKDDVISIGGTENNVISLGSPTHDSYFLSKTNPKKTKKVLLVVSDIFGNNFNGSHTLAYEKLEQFAEKLITVINKSSYTPIIKFRPTQSYYDLKPFIEKLDKNLISYTTEDIKNLIIDSDFVIALNFSTVILDAMILHKPTITILPEDQEYENTPLLQSDSTLAISEIDKVESKLINLFEDTTQQSKLIKNGDQFVSDFFVNKGTSSESIAKFCKKIVDEHNEKME